MTTTRQPETLTVILYFAESPWSLTPERTAYEFEVLGLATGKGGHGLSWLVEAVYIKPPLPSFGNEKLELKAHREILALLETGLNQQLDGKEAFGLGFRGWSKVAELDSVRA